MRIGAVILAASVLCGCGGWQGIAPNADFTDPLGMHHAAQASDDATCRSYGAEPGSDSYVRCRTALATSRAQMNQAALMALIANRPLVQPPPIYTPPPSTTTNCTSSVIGNQVYTNCH